MAPTLRTYKTDVEELLGGGKGSLIGMAAAEQRKAPESARPRLTRADSGATDDKRLLYLKFSLGLIALGIVIISGLYFFTRGNGAVATLPKQTLLTVDTTEEIPIATLDRTGLVSKLKSERTQKDITLNTIHLLSFTTESATAKQAVTARAFLLLLGTRAPDTLLRSLGEKFAYGLHNFRNNQPFLILTVNDPQNAVAGMFAWETSLSDDLQNFFIGTPVPHLSSTNATTTDALLRAGTQGQFGDGVITNKDVRLLRDASGNTIFLYSFVNQKTLVLTTNSDTLKEVIRRLVVSQ